MSEYANLQKEYLKGNVIQNFVPLLMHLKKSKKLPHILNSGLSQCMETQEFPLPPQVMLLPDLLIVYFKFACTLGQNGIILSLTNSRKQIRLHHMFTSQNP